MPKKMIVETIELDKEKKTHNKPVRSVKIKGKYGANRYSLELDEHGILKIMVGTKCPDCGSTELAYDTKSGEVYCIKCKLVAEKSNIGFDSGIRFSPKRVPVREFSPFWEIDLYQTAPEDIKKVIPRKKRRRKKRRVKRLRL